MKRTLIILFACLVFTAPAYAKPGKRSPSSAPALNAGTKEITKEMKVTGQTRTLNMMLVLKNRKDKIEFINVKRNYRKEILGTEY